MKFENQHFSQTTITLDYNEFVNCEIRECMVISYGGPFSLVGTKLDKVRFGAGGSAQQTLAFLRLVRANGAHLLDELLNQGDQPATLPAPGPLTRTN